MTKPRVSGGARASAPGAPADDARLRALLKPLFPRGVELFPLTLQAADLTPQPADLPMPEGLEVEVRTVKVYGVRAPQAVPSVRLHALSALVPAEGAFDTVRKLQKALRPVGYQALVTAEDRGFDFEYVFGIGTLVARERFAGKALVVCFKAPTAFPLLYARGTNGVNYGRGIHTHHIVRRLRDWAAECDYAVLGAGSDWVRLQFRSLPKDLARFGGEVYLLCPEGDHDGEERLPEGLFDLSFEEQQPLASRVGQAFNIRTPADLAPFLGRDGEVFLWWD